MRSLFLAILCAGGSALAQAPPVPAAEAPAPAQEGGIDLPPERAREALEKSLGYLFEKQHEDGSWGAGVPTDLNELGFAWETFYAWNQAANSIALLALLEAPQSEQQQAALERGLDWLCAARISHLGANWDVDSTWASLYGFTTVVAAAGDPRFADEAWQE